MSGEVCMLDLYTSEWPLIQRFCFIPKDNFFGQPVVQYSIGFIFTMRKIKFTQPTAHSPQLTALQMNFLSTFCIHVVFKSSACNSLILLFAFLTNSSVFLLFLRFSVFCWSKLIVICNIIWNIFLHCMQLVLYSLG